MDRYIFILSLNVTIVDPQQNNITTIGVPNPSNIDRSNIGPSVTSPNALTPKSKKIIEQEEMLKKANENNAIIMKQLEGFNERIEARERKLEEEMTARERKLEQEMTALKMEKKLEVEEIKARELKLEQETRAREQKIELETREKVEEMKNAVAQSIAMQQDLANQLAEAQLVMTNPTQLATAVLTMTTEDTKATMEGLSTNLIPLPDKFVLSPPTSRQLENAHQNHYIKLFNSMLAKTALQAHDTSKANGLTDPTAMPDFTFTRKGHLVVWSEVVLVCEVKKDLKGSYHRAFGQVSPFF